MQIILNPALTKKEGWEPRPNTIKSLVDTIGHRLGKGHTFVSSTLRDDSEKQLGFMKTLSRSYSRHDKIEIAPHDIWYIVLSELAEVIKKNQEICRPLFTRSSEKIEILVPVKDVTKIDLHEVVDSLRGLIPVDVTVFLPELSTTTPSAKLALYAALCDGVSGYYDYSTYCCGIPEIRLRGTRYDWNTLYESARSISDMFDSVKLDKAVEYLNRVAVILDDIRQSFDTDKTEFWKNIFTQKNIGSGGELEINGWITRLYFEPRLLKKIETFMVTNTIVSYKNLDTGRKFKGVYGAFETIRTPDDFLSAEYSNLIFEVNE